MRKRRWGCQRCAQLRWRVMICTRAWGHISVAARRQCQSAGFVEKRIIRRRSDSEETMHTCRFKSVGWTSTRFFLVDVIEWRKTMAKRGIGAALRAFRSNDCLHTEACDGRWSTSYGT